MPQYQQGETPFRRRTALIGIGGGGANALSRMVSSDSGPERIAMDTDSQLLGQCNVPHSVLLGEEITEGYSTGGDLELGATAAAHDEMKLRALLSEYDLVWLVISLGGGCGGGSGAVIARLAREEGARVLVMATLPFSFEGMGTRKRAEEGLNRLREMSHAVICLPNDRLKVWLGEDIDMPSAFREMDRMIAGGVQAVWQMLQEPALLNLDFRDLEALVSHSEGTCSFAYADAEGADRVHHVVESILQHPFLERGNALAQARGLVVSVSGGPDLPLRDIERVVSEICSVAPDDVNLYFGFNDKAARRDLLAVTVIASQSWRAVAANLDEVPAPPVPAAAQTPDEEPGEEAAAAPASTGVGAHFEQPDLDLPLEPAGKGRFKDVEPTFYEGADLDVPTFMRRGIKLSGPPGK